MTCPPKTDPNIILGSEGKIFRRRQITFQFEIIGLYSLIKYLFLNYLKRRKQNGKICIRVCQKKMMVKVGLYRRGKGKVSEKLAIIFS